MRHLFALAWIAAAVGCKAMPKASEAPGHLSASAPPIAFEGVRLTAYNGSTPSWILKATRVGYGNPSAHLEGVRLESFRHGRPISVARAPAADLDSRAGTLVMRGPVHVRALRENTDFSADSVTWKANSQHLFAAGHVVFDRGISRLSGQRLEADSQLKRVDILGSVRAKVSLPEADLGHLDEPGRTP